MLLFLSSSDFTSLRSEITSVVFVKRFRLRIPPNFFDHCVNLDYARLSKGMVELRVQKLRWKTYRKCPSAAGI